MSFTHLNYQVSKPSYMDIKKRFTGGNPVFFVLIFFVSSCCNKRLCFWFATRVFNKVPSFTNFGLLRLPKTYGAEIPARTLFSKKFFVAPTELSF
jgi:hypothetical protein